MRIAVGAPIALLWARLRGWTLRTVRVHIGGSGTLEAGLPQTRAATHCDKLAADGQSSCMTVSGHDPDDRPRTARASMTAWLPLIFDQGHTGLDAPAINARDAFVRVALGRLNRTPGSR